MQLVLLGALLAFTWVNADTDVCSLPKETGPCRGSFRRYFFNSGSGKCEQFVFGGCRGNENNFAKKTDCVAKCYQKGEGDVCSLPVKTGYCRGAFPRFFFNAKSGKCEKFIYGGCAGNGNNFKSTEECESRCDYHMSTCKQPKKAGVCRAYMPRFFFNSKSGKCEKFVYGGCGANDNNFETQESCENQCDPQTVCNLPVKVGPCRANMRKLHFNAKSGKCETFFYGGCQGNANNFDTAEECSTTCKPKTDDTGADTDVCKLPAETGPCRAAMPRFFFNSKSEKCEQFIYGGCRGNENNFNTQEDCTGRCSKQAPKEKRNVKTCRLAAESGPCDAYIPRYFFNHNKGQCEKFVYGGCRGNENNFKTFHDCENSCLMKKKREADVCSLPSDSGPCRAAFPRFFFNSKSGNCEQFIFGGCRGNENNFETKDACEGQCKKQEKRETDLCSLPAETGPCRAMMPRFHFNKNSGKCEQFIYGGCQGNQNNFNTKDACEGQCKKQEKRAADVCSLPAETGPCRAMMPRFHFNKNSGKCEQFVYGGCAGNENNFESKDACEGKCAPREKRNVQVCRLPAEVGLCKAIQPRFFFNHKTGLCEKFNYGGCGGNENNFKTLRDCENSCLMKKREADVCALPAETGPCRAMMPRFHFNKDSGKCEQFIYGGCQGNENNFETKDACEGQCKKQQKRETDVCSLPAETGPCRAMMPRFHFNKNSGKCEQFVYGGCGGNENNFASKDACEGKCAPREKRNVQVCRLPAEVGLCKAIQPRFFFNHKTGLCEKFNYGGCGGTENNFKTLRDCENSCLMKKREADVCALPAETGPCRAMMPKFHFNKQSGKCEQFIFGGCGGNENNFNTQAQCESQCASSSQEKSKRGVMVGVCRQEPKSGPCYAYIPRFFFNHKTGTCEKFVFGGCLGNENNFKSLQECERSCLMKKREVDSTCSLPAETGPCRAAMPRFHFNKNSGSCERFIYGGCGGNENNFQSQNQCEEKCMS